MSAKLSTKTIDHAWLMVTHVVLFYATL